MSITLNSREASARCHQDIIAKMENDDQFLIDVLIRLYQLQTQRERDIKTSLARNGVGFSAPDATWLTPLAERVLGGGELTPEELRRVKAALPKYAGQLASTGVIA